MVILTEIEHPIKVEFKGAIVGEYEADLLEDEKVIVELKVAKEYNPKDEPQLLNELKVTTIRVGLLIKFGKRKENSSVSFIKQNQCFISVHPGR